MSDLRFDGTPITDAELLDICNKHIADLKAENAQLQQALDMEAARGAEVLAENTKVRELMQAVVDASRNTTYPDGNPLLLALDAMADYLATLET